MIIFSHPWYAYFAGYIGTILKAKVVPWGTPVGNNQRCLVFGCPLRSGRELAWLRDVVNSSVATALLYVGADIDVLHRYRYKKDLRRLFDIILNGAVVATDGGPGARLRVESIVGREVRRVYLPTRKDIPFRPLPTGPMQVVSRQTAVEPEKYFLPEIWAAAQELPEVTFHIVSPLGFKRWKMLPNVVYHPKPENMGVMLKEMSACLRFAKTDCMSMMSIESMMAGRPVITNDIDMPFSFFCQPEHTAIVAALLSLEERLRKSEWSLKEVSDYYRERHSCQQFVDGIEALLEEARLCRV